MCFDLKHLSVCCCLFTALRLKSRQVKKVRWTLALDMNRWYTKPRMDTSWWWDESRAFCSALKCICTQTDTTWIKWFVSAGCHSSSDTVTCVGLRRHTRSPCIFHQETPKGRSAFLQETHLTWNKQHFRKHGWACFIVQQHTFSSINTGQQWF